jgi:hypothetical protein
VEVEDNSNRVAAHIQLVALWRTSCALRNQRRGLETAVPSTSLLRSIFQGYLLWTKIDGEKH